MIRDLVLVIGALSLAVITPVSYLSSQARRDISEQFINHASSRAVDRFRTMSQSMEVTLSLMREWGAAGRITLDKGDELAQLLFPIFGQEQLLHGISVANIDGSSVYVSRLDDGGYKSRWIVYKKAGENTTEDVFWSAAFDVLERSEDLSGFDPRGRPWFAPALASRGVHWTEPYKFFTARRVGITASTSFIRQKDKRQVVVAFDVLLDEPFSDFFELAPSENSRVIIFRHDNQLYIPGRGGSQPGFLPMGNVEDSLVRKVHSNWTGADDLADRVISVFHEGMVWWCGFEPLERDGPNTWICVMVPEDDILKQAGKRTLHLWIIGLASLMTAVGLAFWIIRRYRRPFEGGTLFDPEHPEASVRNLIAAGENRAVEFKSTMRMNLHSRKPGKEIELAWMKGVAGFLNTDGGVLLLGVTDDGEITGLERDVFENEDKCRLHFKNLISKHLGADHSKYVRFLIVPMDGKTVGVVRCARSEDPVFLKDGNKEHFYIRNGPASDELPVSQALNYIKHRN
jgi:hypothetical protein